MKKLSMIALFSASLLTAGSAFAGGGGLLGGSGSSSMAAGTMYGGANVGKATTSCMMLDTEDCDATGWKVYGGYKITDMFAVEGGYHNLGTMEEKLSGSYEVQSPAGSVVIDNPSAEGTSTGLSISGVASLPVGDNFEVFGKLGAINWKSEATATATATGTNVEKSFTAEKSGTSPLIGVGAQYQINDNFGVRGEYERFTRQDLDDKDHDVDILSVGATFSTL